MQRGQAVHIINAYAEVMAGSQRGRRSASRGEQPRGRAEDQAVGPKRKLPLMSMDDFIAKVM